MSLEDIKIGIVQGFAFAIGVALATLLLKKGFNLDA